MAEAGGRNEEMAVAGGPWRLAPGAGDGAYFLIMICTLICFLLSYLTYTVISLIYYILISTYLIIKDS